MLLCGELLNIATVQELKKAIEDATAQYDSIKRSLVIPRILKGFEILKTYQKQGQLISTYLLGFVLMLSKTTTAPSVILIG